MATIHSPAQNTEAVMRIQEGVLSGEIIQSVVRIGLREDTYLWSDGSDADYLNWYLKKKEEGAEIYVCLFFCFFFYFILCSPPPPKKKK